MKTTLVWPPVYTALEEQIRTGDTVALVLVPFAKLAAVQKLHEVQNPRVPLKLICRWRPADLLAAVSDIELFPYLDGLGSQIFIHPDIHLKLYIFQSNLAFNTSGNLTLSGLGYSPQANIEVGNMLQLAVEDWHHIYQLIQHSRRVDAGIFERLRSFLAGQPASQPSVAYPPDIFGERKQFTIASLPAMETPLHFQNYYQNPNDPNMSPEALRQGMHDMDIYGLAANLPAESFEAQLGSAFRATPFVSAFVAHLKSERSLHFGAVNTWIHQQCEDVPLPYRWEIKDNTRVFYNWLAQFFHEITWDRPNYSQVIYWNQERSTD